MPLITGLEPTRRDPTRLSVFLDGEFAFALSGEAAYAAGLRVGESLDPAMIDRLVADDEAQRAVQSGLRYLAARPRSEAEIRRRLREKGYGPAAIDAATIRLRELGYLDDRAFADFWVAGRRAHKPRSARLLAYELRQKGVADEAIDLSEWDDLAAARAAGERWLRSRRFASREEFERRLGAHLQRRGFGGTTIRAALRDLWDPAHSH